MLKISKKTEYFLKILTRSLNKKKQWKLLFQNVFYFLFYFKNTPTGSQRPKSLSIPKVINDPLHYTSILPYIGS